MGLLDLFRSKKPKGPPTPFDTLAAFSKFQNVSECSPEFYAKYKKAIDVTVGFLAFVSSQHESLAKVLAHSSVPVRDIAKGVESAMASAKLEQHALDFINSTMTTIMESLLPAVKDPELPEYLKVCVWAIEGAFEEKEPTKTTS
jgi:uncharacterized protein (UPF0147 family)